jgi:ATP-dependent exoDNAse (exonuclease V) beta subunit
LKCEYHYEGTVTGEIAHKLMYEISIDRINIRTEYIKRVEFYLKKSGFDENQELRNVLTDIYELINETPELKTITEKRKNGFSEMPFIVENKGRIYTGFIDRIILEGENKCNIYDYKMDMGNADKFKEQMDIYEKAAVKIFPERDIIKR